MHKGVTLHQFMTFLAPKQLITAYTSHPLIVLQPPIKEEMAQFKQNLNVHAESQPAQLE